MNRENEYEEDTSEGDLDLLEIKREALGAGFVGVTPLGVNTCHTRVEIHISKYLILILYVNCKQFKIHNVIKL